MSLFDQTEDGRTILTLIVLIELAPADDCEFEWQFIKVLRLFFILWWLDHWFLVAFCKFGGRGKLKSTAWDQGRSIQSIFAGRVPSRRRHHHAHSVDLATITTRAKL